ncbi:carotenoid oxygenase family protein [Streptomyces sp. NBC_01808]|uniref:carotenoid oxygenase family protein n=1 Tax=Streptomyces sp. NBC_01808 TaxID=2975947 RepID=UPI002DDA178F|nr:carotenoid oxygenase family protein [Streptomyces sp. NBC_01808]WSA41129.1 carotenoid oxygenase family protein [Streptomyces sp. NBC_01808]
MNVSAHSIGFRTLGDETTIEELPVKGALPGWLEGSLLRNGPARYDAGERSVRHWFDGQAMLHRFTFGGGQVSYANRYLDTPANRAMAAGRISFREFATDPCRSLFARFFTRFSRKPSANANVNITRFGDRYVALTETPLPVAFDPDTLATAGVVGYDDALSGQLTTAHPHQDPATGDLVNYVLHFSRTSEYRIYRQPSSGTTRELIGSRKVARPSYMHSFAITRRHVVLAEFPLVVNPLSIVLSGRPFIENYHWEPERGTRFTVMDSRDGTVRGTYEGPAFFAFHHINAFDDGDDVVLDICSYDDASIIEALYLDRLHGGGVIPLARPTRYRIPLGDGAGGGSVGVQRLSEETLELPRISYARHNGSPYRYAYGVGTRDRSSAHFIDQLVKLDVTTGDTLTWSEEGCYPGEPVFVAAPTAASDAAGEDDGVVLSVVLDSAAGTSFLLVLDARTFAELARAEVPHAVPFGFHGVFTGRRRP